MASTLDQIMARTAALVAERKAVADHTQLERHARELTPLGFAAGLSATARQRPAVIAECKRASPSKGVLCEDYRPALIAAEYETAGAAAISVLTEPEFFLGSLDDLASVAEAVKIPVLRKDFMLDEFQVLEARAAGASAILLIVAALPDAQLRALADSARVHELDVLCEVHDSEELRRALDLGFELIGVNCRNLKTLAVDPAVHEQLAGSIPANVIRVAESGIRTPADIARLRGFGYQAFLVGEMLMKQSSPGAALRELIGEATCG